MFGFTILLSRKESVPLATNRARLVVGVKELKTVRNSPKLIAVLNAIKGVVLDRNRASAATFSVPEGAQDPNKAIA